MTSASTTSSNSVVQPQTLFFVSFILAAAVYISLSGMGLRGPWMAALKILPIAMLVILAAGRLSGLSRGLTVGALLLSALGDVFLALDFPNQFVFGLGAFLLAQLTYGASFLRASDFRNKRSILRGLPLVIASFLLALVLLPKAGELAPAVMFYLLAILFMALSAAAHRGASALLFAGAVSFMISDSLIAINKFLTPLPLSGLAVMSTYYLAQLLLVTGILRLRT